MATLDVITLAEAKVALSMGATTNYDTALTALITAISDRLDEAVGPIVQRTITAETYDGTDWYRMRRVPMIQLRSWPVVSVTTVVEDSTTLTTDQYHIDSEKGQLYRTVGDGVDYIWAHGRDNVSVTYSAGRYAATASVTERYKQGAYLMLAHLWRSRQWSTSGITSGGDFNVPAVAFPAFSIPNAVVEWFGTQWRDRKRGGFA